MNDEAIFAQYGYRKVLFDIDCYIYMRNNEINLPDVLRALWKSSPDLPTLIEAFEKVAARRTARFRQWCCIEDGYQTQRLALVALPSDNLIKSLESIFRAAKLPLMMIYNTMTTFDWQRLVSLVEESKRLYALEQVKRHIDSAAKSIGKITIDEFIAQYPEYKYAAHAISKVPRVASDDE